MKSVKTVIVVLNLPQGHLPSMEGEKIIEIIIAR